MAETESKVGCQQSSLPEPREARDTPYDINLPLPGSDQTSACQPYGYRKGKDCDCNPSKLNRCRPRFHTSFPNGENNDLFQTTVQL
jgi:hypothetical protein